MNTVFLDLSERSYSVECAEGARFVFNFPTGEAEVSRSGDDLVFALENGISITLTDFYSAYTAKNMPVFEVAGQQVAGEAFLAALSQPELMPAAGPEPVSNSHYQEWSNMELLGGLDRLGGLDVGWKDGGILDRPTGGGGEGGGSEQTPEELFASLSVSASGTENDIREVVFTVTLDRVSLGDVTVTLSSGHTVVIPAGETSVSVVIPTRADDVYLQGGDVYSSAIENVTSSFGLDIPVWDGGSVSASVTDDADVTKYSITAVDTDEAAGKVAFIIEAENVPQSAAAVTVTVGGAEYVVNFAAGQKTATLEVTNPNTEDVYLDASTLTAAITKIEGGNYEAVQTGATATADIVDTIDTTEFFLSAGTANRAGDVVFTVTASELPHSDDSVIVYVQVAGEEEPRAIVLGADGTATFVASVGEDLAVDASITGVKHSHYEAVSFEGASASVVVDKPEDLTFTTQDADVLEHSFDSYSRPIAAGITLTQEAVDAVNATISYGKFSLVDGQLVFTQNEAYTHASTEDAKTFKTVSFDVTDSKGNETTLEVTVTIEDDAPKLTVDDDNESLTYDTESFSVIGTLEKTLAASAEADGLDGVKVYLQTGVDSEGNPVYGEGVSAGADGTYVFANVGTVKIDGTAVQFKSAYASGSAASYSFKVEITDGDDDVASDMVSTHLNASTVGTATVTGDDDNVLIENHSGVPVTLPTLPAGATLADQTVDVTLGKDVYGTIVVENGVATFYQSKAYTGAQHGAHNGEAETATGFIGTLQVTLADGSNLDMKVNVSITDDAPGSVPDLKIEAQNVFGGEKVFDSESSFVFKLDNTTLDRLTFGADADGAKVNVEVNAKEDGSELVYTTVWTAKVSVVNGKLTFSKFTPSSNEDSGEDLRYDSATGEFIYTRPDSHVNDGHKPDSDPVPNKSDTYEVKLSITDADGDTSDGSIVSVTTIAGDKVDVDSNNPNINVGDNDGTGIVIIGNAEHHIVAGDTSASVTAGSAIAPTYNYCFVLDVSGSMKESVSAGKDRLDVAVESILNFIENSIIDNSALSNGTVNIAVVPFESRQRNTITLTLVKENGKTYIQNGNSREEITSLDNQSFENSLESLNHNGGTNYEAGFRGAATWFSTTLGADKTSSAKANVTYFLSDGVPTFHGIESEGGGSYATKSDVEGAWNGYQALLASVGSAESSMKVNSIGFGSDLGAEAMKTLAMLDNTASSGSSGGATEFKADGKLYYSGWWGYEPYDPVPNDDNGGSATQVTTGDQLSAALASGFTGATIADAASDDINASAAISLENFIFGDVMNTDELRMSNEGTEVTRGMADGSGFAVFSTLGWNNTKIADYIADHSLELAREMLILPHANDTGFDVYYRDAFGRVFADDDLTTPVTNSAILSKLDGRDGGGDSIIGTQTVDHIFGQEGDDTIYGGAGDDFIAGGSGADELHGDAGNDIMVYDAMDKLISGDDGIDFLLGTDSSLSLASLLSGGKVKDVEVLITGSDVVSLTSISDLADKGISLGKTADGKDTLTLDGNKWGKQDDGSFDYIGDSDDKPGVDFDLSIQLKLNNTDGLSETEQMVFILNNTQG